jgi:hypothetical protein
MIISSHRRAMAMELKIRKPPANLTGAFTEKLVGRFDRFIETMEINKPKKE